jgi:endonuclease/exonuclease/phosphatase (EEP) superfamily protein YafD
MEELSKPKRTKGKAARFGISLGLTVFFAFAYAVRPDALQMLHWWPICFWTPVILLPFFWRYGRGPVWMLLIWIGTVTYFDSAWRWPLHPTERTGLRIISLNCAGGDAAAMREALSSGADIVLLQEVAGSEEVIALGGEFGYRHSVVGLDTAILAKGPVANSIRDRDFVAAEVTRGTTILKVVSLRLKPPVFRLDFYNPAAWSEYREDAASRRARLKEIQTQSRAEIVGGDFNSTNPHLVEGLQEAHQVVGRGWPGTDTNDYPYVRVDQIWGGENIKFHQSYVTKTENSDHRMVIADFELIAR